MTNLLYALANPALGLGLATAIGLAAVQIWPGSASAQGPGAGLGTSYSANSSKPVDIEADSLEVDDRKKTAVFKGNVSATQGDVNMKSREIFVTYKGSEKNTASADTSAAPAPASPLGGGGEVTQIDAKGDVFVTMKSSKSGEKPQQAKSDWAIFDVKKQQITIGGDVVLSQGENVIRGNKLVIDLTTGLSRFENTGTASAGGGRMRAIFTPPPKKDDAK